MNEIEAQVSLHAVKSACQLNTEQLKLDMQSHWLIMGTVRSGKHHVLIPGPN